jgi:hypothetical protein
VPFSKRVAQSFDHGENCLSIRDEELNDFADIRDLRRGAKEICDWLWRAIPHEDVPPRRAQPGRRTRTDDAKAD